MLIGCSSNSPTADIDNVQTHGNTLTFDVTTQNGDTIDEYEIHVLRGETNVHSFSDEELSKDGKIRDITVNALLPGEHTIEAHAQYEANGETVDQVIGEYHFSFELPAKAPQATITDIDLGGDRIDFDLNVEELDEMIDQFRIRLYDDQGNALVEINNTKVQTLTYQDELIYNNDLYFRNLEPNTSYVIHVYGDFVIDESPYKWIIMDTLPFTTAED